MKTNSKYQKRASWLSAVLVLGLLFGLTGIHNDQVFAQQEEPPQTEPTLPAEPPQEPVETPIEPVIEEPTPEPVEEFPQAPLPEFQISTVQEGNISTADISTAASIGVVKRIADIYPYSKSSSPAHFCIFNGPMYFSANGGNGYGRELWVYDGSNKPKMAKDIRIGSASSDPRYLVVFRNRLFFSADGGGSRGRELWSFEGSSLRMVEIRSGSAGSDPQYLTSFNGKLYFSAEGSDGLGRELWVYDGLVKPKRLMDINPGSASSFPVGLRVFDGQLYFSATDGSGYKIWVYDGFNPPTVAPNSGNWGGVAYRPEYLTVFNSKLYFSADDDTGKGRELWSYDGVNAPTLVADIAADELPSDPQHLRTFNGMLFFSADGWDDPYRGRELWYYDGTNPPARAADIWRGADSSNPRWLYPFKSKLFFSADGGDVKGNELWAFMPIITKTFRSTGTYDGWVRESSETSSKGGTINSSATTLRVGDDDSDRQYRSILHFKTSSLPDNAVIQALTLKVKSESITGDNPFDTHGNIRVDMKKGAFSDSSSLQSADFQASASKSSAGSFTNAPVLDWYTLNLGSSNYTYVHKAGNTQFRLRFSTGDNDDMSADYISFYSGNAAVTDDRPSLTIKYYVP